MPFQSASTDPVPTPIEEDDNTASNAGNSNSEHKGMLTANQIYESHQIYVNSDHAATAASKANGATKQDAEDIGKKEGYKSASSWNDLVRTGNADAASFGWNFLPLTTTSWGNNATNSNKKIN